MTTSNIRAALERLVAVAYAAAQSANIGIMDDAIATARAALAAQQQGAPPLLPTMTTPLLPTPPKTQP